MQARSQEPGSSSCEPARVGPTSASDSTTSEAGKPAPRPPPSLAGYREPSCGSGGHCRKLKSGSSRREARRGATTRLKASCACPAATRVVAKRGAVTGALPPRRGCEGMTTGDRCLFESPSYPSHPDNVTSIIVLMSPPAPASSDERKVTEFIGRVNRKSWSGSGSPERPCGRCCAATEKGQ